MAVRVPAVGGKDVDQNIQPDARVIARSWHRGSSRSDERLPVQAELTNGRPYRTGLQILTPPIGHGCSLTVDRVEPFCVVSA